MTLSVLKTAPGRIQAVAGPQQGCGKDTQSLSGAQRSLLMRAPLHPAPKPFQESEVAGAGLPPEGTHLSPGDSRACSPCLLLSGDASVQECLDLHSLLRELMHYG